MTKNGEVFHPWVRVQFEAREEVRRRRWLISAQGWSVSDNLGIQNNPHSTLKGFAPNERLQRFANFLFGNPRLSLTLQPWAEISQRLRRIIFFKLNQYCLVRLFCGMVSTSHLI